MVASMQEIQAALNFFLMVTLQSCPNIAWFIIGGKEVASKDKCVPTQYTFNLRTVLFWSLKWRQIKKLVWESRKEEYVYLKNWFKQIFPLFLTWPLHKLKCLIPMVDFAPPILLAMLMPMHPNISNVMLTLISRFCLAF